MSVLPTAANQQNAIARFLQLIRFSHTIFALPFALGALVVAANGRPTARVLLLVMLCMVFARTAAMLFNRIVDWSLDQRNPRTAARHLLIAKGWATFFLVLCSLAFVLSAFLDQSSDRAARCACARHHFLLLGDETFHERDAFFSRARPGCRTNRSMARANRPLRPATIHPWLRRDLLGERLRHHLRHAGLRFRSARRFALTCREIRSRSKSPSRGMAAPGDVHRAGCIWLIRQTRSDLFLLASPRRGGASLRTSHSQKTRRRRNQSRLFPKQRIC